MLLDQTTDVRPLGSRTLDGGRQFQNRLIVVGDTGRLSFPSIFRKCLGGKSVLIPEARTFQSSFDA